MTLSEILASMTRTGDSWSAPIPEGWLQGRSAFGGLQTAIGLRALRALVPGEVPLRIIQTTFIGPVPHGDVRVNAAILRKGKNVIHAEARLSDGENVLAVVIGVFGSARASRVNAVPRAEPIPSFPEPVEFPFAQGMAPNFIQNFRVRWLGGALPFTTAERGDATLEVDVRESGALTEAHLVAIADVPPPMAFAMLDGPVPGSSLTWTLELLTTGAALGALPLEGYRLECELSAGGEGYTSQSVTVLGPHGNAVALSRQAMVVFG